MPKIRFPSIQNNLPEVERFSGKAIRYKSRAPVIMDQSQLRIKPIGCNVLNSSRSGSVRWLQFSPIDAIGGSYGISRRILGGGS
jgi:hypothetical protein